MLANGLTEAVSRWSSGMPPVWLNVHLLLRRKTVVRRLFAFAVLMVLVLSMAGCKLVDIA